MPCICITLANMMTLLMTAVLAQEPVADWAHKVSLPAGERPIDLFNGRDLTGWAGEKEKHFSVVDGMIRAANSDPVTASTYLFTEKSYRHFRLLLEVKQTRGEEYSPMHSAVAALGEQIEDQGEKFGFRGPLIMFCQDWGIWDANRRDRVEPRGQQGPINNAPYERVGEWNQIEILVVGNRIRCVANGHLSFDFTDKPAMLRASPLGLQLHSNQGPQEWHFRGLVLVENPVDELVTLAK
jgi:Domain of Unknown Function (DUF1080)